MAEEIETISGGSLWYRNIPPNHLGESPIYRSSDSTLHWLDCLSTPCSLHILPVSPTTGDALGPARVVPIPFALTSVIYFRKDVPGSYVCGYRQGIGFLDEETGEVTVLKELLGKETMGEMSMNDGGVDPQGRFWVGEIDVKTLTAGLGGEKLEDGYGDPRGRLWRYDPDGTCTVMDEGITCANGIGWSPDGNFMFFNDSGPQILWRYDFDGETGNVSNKTKIFDGLGKGVFNDGMVVDVDGNLWIAMFMDHCLIRFSPRGKLLQKIVFPAKCMTCPTWGGENNDILFLTSAQPLAEKAAPGDEGGHLFRYKPGVKGMPKNRFCG